MIQKVMFKEDKTPLWLQYEKRRVRECAGTLHNLASAFLTEEKEETESDRQNLFWKKRLREDRVLIADHLKEMAHLMQEVSEEKVRLIRLDAKKEKQLARLLFLEGLELEDFYMLEKEDKRKELLLRVCQNNLSGKKKCCTAEEAAAFLSVFLNLRLVPSIGSPFFVTDKPENFWFEEDTRYMVLTGFAKMTKEGEKISGDNHVFFESVDKKFHGILSDGMGSGEKACEESETVIEMAQNFLDGGFSHKLTAKMINDTLLVNSEGRNMSTLDMCSIDLYTGKAHFLKVGAAYGLLKRDSYVEKIPSISLPLGVFYELEMNEYTKQLLDGDYVILFSDGILEHFCGEKGEAFLKETVAQIPYRRPSEMAGYLMKHAIAASKGAVRDDMTVLVLGMWENMEQD